ncbi:RNA-directed DNA polymerase, eukaryota, reverse transcriptase zinc-binding domain protein [Tanacetum coccineum]
MVLNYSKQIVLCQIEVLNSNIRCFCSFVYATNIRTERKNLWRDLKAAKIIINDSPCMLVGDFNVTLKVVKHTAGGSTMTNDIQDLIDSVSEIEVEDIYHSGVVLIVPKSIQKKYKPFKFANYITDKVDFSYVVKNGWDIKVNGCHMFKIDWLKYSDKNMDNVIPIVDVDSLFSSKLDDNKALDMVREETDIKINNVVFDIGDVKSPGPDGYSSTFFKNSWKIVGKDVCNVV